MTALLIYAGIVGAFLLVAVVLARLQSAGVWSAGEDGKDRGTWTGSSCGGCGCGG